MALTLANPDLRAAVDELRRRARKQGLDVRVTSGDRSRAEQERLWANRGSNPNPVARPGASAHELGQAVDLNVFRLKDGQRISPGEIAGLAGEVGLRWHGDADPVHFRLAPSSSVEPTADELAAAQLILGSGPQRMAAPQGPAGPLAAAARRMDAQPTADELAAAQLILGSQGAKLGFANRSAANEAPAPASPSITQQKPLVGLYDPAFHGPRSQGGGEKGGPFKAEVEGLFGELFDPQKQQQREAALRVYGGGRTLVYDPLERREIRPRNAQEHHRDSGASVVAPGLLEANWAAKKDYRQQQLAGKVPLAPELSRDERVRGRQIQELRTVQDLIQRHDDEVRKRYEPQMLEASSGIGVGTKMSDPAAQGTLRRMRQVGDQVRGELTPQKFLAWAKAKGIALTPYQRAAVGSLVAWKDISAAHDEEKVRAGIDAVQWGAALEGAGPVIETFGRPVLSWLGHIARRGGELLEPLVRSGVKKAGDLAQGGGGRVLRELAYLGKTAKGYMSTLGPAGKQLGSDLERVSMLADRAAGQTGKASQEHLKTAAQEVWGEDLERLLPHVEWIAKEKSPAEAERVLRFVMSDVMGDPKFAAKAPGSRLFKALAKYETVTKLGLRPLSALRNATQRLTNSGLEYGVGPVLRAQAELLTPWRKAGWLMKEAMTEAGVFAGETGGRETVGNRVANWTLGLFDKAEAGNRYVAARVKQLGMEQDLNLLLQLEKERPAVSRLREFLSLGSRSAGAAERRLARAGLDAEALKEAIANGGQLTPEQVQTAMWKAVQDQQFAQSLASSPMWWKSSPAMRALTQFKTFGAKQTNLVWEYVAKELKHGNGAPLARYLLFTSIAGELYHASQDVMKGGKSSVSATVAGQLQDGKPVDARAVAKRMFGNFAAGGGLGLLTDFVLAPGGDDPFDRVANFAIGPAGGTVRNVKNTAGKIQRDPQDARKAMRELVEEEAPAVRDWRKAGERASRSVRGKPGDPRRDRRELQPLQQQAR